MEYRASQGDFALDIETDGVEFVVTGYFWHREKDSVEVDVDSISSGDQDLSFVLMEQVVENIRQRVADALLEV